MDPQQQAQPRTGPAVPTAPSGSPSEWRLQVRLCILSLCPCITFLQREAYHLWGGPRGTETRRCDLGAWASSLFRCRARRGDLGVPEGFSDQAEH